jgi:sialic acid synthase SpsE
MTSSPVYIGDVPVGDGYPTVFMAEIGTFFNKDIDLALKLVKAAVDAGAPVVKSEVLHNPDVCIKDSGLLVKYNHAFGSKTENYRAAIERKIVPLERYRELYGYCKSLGVPFVASVYDVEGIDFFVEIGGAAIKIASHQIGNIPLIRYAAATGLAILIDTGRAYFHEVARMVYEAQQAGSGGVIVLHHPGANPAPPEAHHMRVMQTYKEALNVPVGLTCHYRGDEILYLAVGMGANILEKGVVDDPDREEMDLVSAASLSETPAIIRKVQNCWQAIGAAPMRPKEPRDLSDRKALVARRPIAAGEAIGYDNVLFAWPPSGIPAESWDVVVGKPVTRSLAANEVIRWSDVQLDEPARTIR